MCVCVAPIVFRESGYRKEREVDPQLALAKDEFRVHILLVRILFRSLKKKPRGELVTRQFFRPCLLRLLVIRRGAGALWRIVRALESRWSVACMGRQLQRSIITQRTVFFSLYRVFTIQRLL
jgi:hypothetical protein